MNVFYNKLYCNIIIPWGVIKIERRFTYTTPSFFIIFYLNLHESYLDVMRLFFLIFHVSTYV